MCAMLGSGFDPAVPADSEAVSQGAARIRDLKQRLKDWASVSFDLDTGELLPGAVPGTLHTPYGAAGSVLTSTGPATPPEWGAQTGVPTGVVLAWPTDVVPTGYLECDGSTKSIATYPALAAVLGTTYGGDGVNTFGLPDLRGRTVAGRGTGDATDASAWTLAQKRGAETHSLTGPQNGPHTHTTTIQYSNEDGNTNPWGSGGAATEGSIQFTTGSSGSGDAHNNLQPSLCLLYIIKT